MKRQTISLDAIEKNPFRHLKSNPLDVEHVKQLAASIKEHAFWEGLVCRPHPKKSGRFQLAFGHHRVEACRQTGLEEIPINVVEQLSDWKMTVMMLEENAGQRHLSTEAMVEDLESAVLMLDTIVRESNTAEEFSERMGHPHLDADDDRGVRESFSKVKKEIADFGFGGSFADYWLPVSKGSVLPMNHRRG